MATGMFTWFTFGLKILLKLYLMFLDCLLILALISCSHVTDTAFLPMFIGINYFASQSSINICTASTLSYLVHICHTLVGWSVLLYLNIYKHYRIIF